jgi:hypothetical protein
MFYMPNSIRDYVLHAASKPSSLEMGYIKFKSLILELNTLLTSIEETAIALTFRNTVHLVRMQLLLCGIKKKILICILCISTKLRCYVRHIRGFLFYSAFKTFHP